MGSCPQEPPRGLHPVPVLGSRDGLLELDEEGPGMEAVGHGPTLSCWLKGCDTAVLKVVRIELIVGCLTCCGRCTRGQTQSLRCRNCQTVLAGRWGHSAS